MTNKILYVLAVIVLTMSVLYELHSGELLMKGLQVKKSEHSFLFNFVILAELFGIIYFLIMFFGNHDSKGNKGKRGRS